MLFGVPSRKGRCPPQGKLFNLIEFNELGLAPSILKSVHALGFETPTPIQEKSIPLVLQGHDLMGLAQTGTGKTAAFGLPLVHHLMSVGTKPEPKTARALILAPTRELVNQIADNLRQYVRNTHLRINLVIGGASINTQRRNLERGTDILVATPGRLLDLVDRKAIYLDSVKYLVLDEADQMLDLGFIHALRQIARLLGTPRQTLLFSATMPKQVEKLSQAYLNDPVRVQTTPPGKAADKINQSIHFVHQRSKTDFLIDCLAQRPNDLSLVFARTKHGAEKLMKKLVASGLQARSIHGNKSQNQRDRAIKAFRSGEVRILVATDVAARGIDIPGVTHVYNYDLPDVPESYVHRIGRTARAGAAGEAVAFCSPEELHLLRAIEKQMGISVRVGSGDVPSESEGAAARPRGRNGGRSRNGANGGQPQNSSSGKPKRHRNRRKAVNGSQDNSGGGQEAARGGNRGQKPGGKSAGKNRHQPPHANNNSSKPGGNRRRRSNRRPVAA
ncbi:MAG: DEAD/DEAH box helicase [Hyphomicrobiales bacterium]|nr:DEAD/DEAH box helicase [Hyphomicrobiales bacterium]MCP4999200.1 DEAD/DEAH box helicase [Hyphomicrobiales bacterium]